METVAIQNQDFLHVEIKLRVATAADFKTTAFVTENGRVINKTVPKIGQPYWLKSIKDGEVDNRQYQIHEDTDWNELRMYMRQTMVYVAASLFEIKDRNNNN
ncbi:hypothetical protein ACFFVB_18285 [Formosa undariae]|uniref:Uncharacterized protein n=1 Tax=Formosa undariae TaxID=1325436 RepID=A0ABV5F6H5_9FLAO